MKFATEMNGKESEMKRRNGFTVLLSLMILIGTVSALPKRVCAETTQAGGERFMSLFWILFGVLMILILVTVLIIILLSRDDSKDKNKGKDK